MAWIEPIYDRTQQDVNYVKTLIHNIKEGAATTQQINEYKRDLKGAINKSDLQRIVGNIKYLADELNVTITNQTVPAIPRVSWYTTLLNNLRLVLNSYLKHSDTPNIPSQPLNTYKKWNTIEKILWDINDIYIANEYYYCGDDLYMNENSLI